MAREARLHIPYALYHVSLHGNAGQLLFTDKQDGQYFYQLLADGSQKFGYDVLGFCLMEDHVHLAIQIANVSLSKIIHNLTFRYTRQFNKRHQRQGHLFVGRYKSTVVQGDNYLPDLIRYIHLTPVRLAAVQKPEEYLWSSHRVHLDKEKLSWVNTQILADHFKSKKASFVEQYQAFINAGMEYGRPKDLAAAKFNGRIFGDADFISATLNTVKQQTKHSSITVDELLNIVCHEYALTEEELTSLGKQRNASIPRGVLAYLVKQCPDITFTDLAKRVQRDATTLSAHASRIEKQCRDNPQLAEFIQKVKTQIIS